MEIDWPILALGSPAALLDDDLAVLQAEVDEIILRGVEVRLQRSRNERGVGSYQQLRRLAIGTAQRVTVGVGALVRQRQQKLMQQATRGLRLATVLYQRCLLPPSCH